MRVHMLCACAARPDLLIDHVYDLEDGEAAGLIRAGDAEPAPEETEPEDEGPEDEGPDEEGVLDTPEAGVVRRRRGRPPKVR